jgi:hypothetical protein
MHPEVAAMKNTQVDDFCKKFEWKKFLLVS